MEKGKPEFGIKIGIWGKDKKDNSLHFYLWDKIISQKIETDERCHPIAKALAKVKFLISIEILLGRYSSSPLFIEIGKMGDTSFFESKPDPVGFSLFDSDISSLNKSAEKKIQKEFRNKLFEFLEQRQKQNMREIVCYQNKTTELVNKVIKYKQVLRQLCL